MSQSSSQPQEAQTSNESPSKVKAALDCPEILSTIGEWIQSRPQTLSRCCLVSKFWCEVFTPLLWSVSERRPRVAVPEDLWAKYSHHVRTLDLHLAETGHQEPPMHKHLRHLTIEVSGVVSCNEALRRLIGANMNLVELRLLNVELFHEDDHNALSLTNPLGHLKTTLRELTLKRMHFTGNELYYTLRDVAEGSLRTLRLGAINGSFDLQDLFFQSLTRLHLRLRETTRNNHYEIIGRSPHLNHLELYDEFDLDDWTDGIIGYYSIEPLVHLLGGTHQIDQSNPGTTRGQWTRPQLATLRLYLDRAHTQGWEIQESVNNHDYLELIRACSSTYNKLNQTGHCGSLRELVITLLTLGDDVMGAIEMHGESLEVLRITMEYDVWRTSEDSTDNHGRALAKIFQSCQRLKELEYRNVNKNADIVLMTKGLIEDHSDKRGGDPNGHDCTQQAVIGQMPGPSWNCPDLESLKISLTAPGDPERLEGERWLVDGDTDGSNSNSHGSSTWRMPSFRWDPNVNDGTAFLLDASGHGLPKEGEELLMKLLRHVSPSKKLKTIQLAQLKLVKPCMCGSCSQVGQVPNARFSLNT